jgi:RNA polymerase sigma factor (sigma-70 family)
MVNTYTSQRRKKSSTELTTDELPDPPSTHPGPEATHVERDQMWQALATLPRAERVALVLKFYEDLSDQAAAQLLGCRPSTFRANASRGVARLREQVLQEGTVSS